MLIYTNKKSNFKLNSLDQLFNNCIIDIDSLLSIGIVQLLEYSLKNHLTVYVNGIIPITAIPYILNYEINLNEIYSISSYKILHDTILNLHHLFYLLRNKIIINTNIDTKVLNHFIYISRFIKKFKRVPHFNILPILRNEKNI